jgi:serine/threonine-protein kinase
MSAEGATSPSQEAESLISLLKQLADVGEAEALRVKVGDRLGRYQLTDRLGQGGFGVVFEARDTDLGRLVALKLMRPRGAPDARLHEQFHREAEAVAHLNHPRIVTIHDFGVSGGVPFLVLERLRGETLAARLERGPLELRAALDVAIAVAEGIAHAHAAGLVHRDLKPSNVFLTDSGGVKLLDFGLVRGRGASDVLEGAGTPEYMAPEQRDGGVADARSDVFALGLLLVETLTGRRGSEAARGLEVPRAVRDTIARALERDPAARFPDGGALLDALTAARRALDRRRGRRLAAAIATGALLLAGAAGIAQLKARRLATTRVRLAAQVGEQVRDLEASLRYAYLQPLHDVEPEEAQVRARLGRVQATLDASGDLGEGAGELALGRGYLALHDGRRAQEHLEAAERLGYHSAELDGALGQALGERYRDESAALERIRDERERAERRRALEARYRDPALARLGAARSQTSYALALLQLFERRYDDALASAERAFAEQSWRYEALELEGDVRVERARGLVDAAQFTEALGDLALAREAYGRAAAIARSDPDLFVADCRRGELELEIAARSKHERPSAYEDARASCARAVEAAPHRIAALTAAADLRLARESVRPTESGALLDEALGFAERAAATSPPDERGVLALGRVRARRAAERRYGGGDPAAELAAAEAAFARLPAGEIDDQAAADLAQLENTRAEAELDRGVDPRPLLARTLAILEGRRGADALAQAGRAFTTMAQYEGDHGVDPHPSFARANDAYDRALALRPDHERMLDWQSTTYFYLAIYEREHGLDAAESFRRSLALSERALALHPDGSVVRLNFGTALMEAAVNEIERDRDPRPLLERGRAEISRSLELRPGVPDAYNSLALIERTWAEWLVGQGLDADAQLAAGFDAIARAQALTKNDRANLPVLADLEKIAGDQDAKRRRSPLPRYARALAYYRRLLALDPKSVPLRLGDGETLRRRAEWLVAGGGDATTDLASGLDEAKQAHALAPDTAPPLVLEGKLRVLRARAARSPVERREQAQAALAAFEQARARSAAAMAPVARWIDEARRALQ